MFRPGIWEGSELTLLMKQVKHCRRVNYHFTRLREVLAAYPGLVVSTLRM